MWASSARASASRIVAGARSGGGSWQTRGPRLQAPGTQASAQTEADLAERRAPIDHARGPRMSRLQNGIGGNKRNNVIA